MIHIYVLPCDRNIKVAQRDLLQGRYTARGSMASNKKTQEQKKDKEHLRKRRLWKLLTISFTGIVLAFMCWIELSQNRLIMTEIITIVQTLIIGAWILLWTVVFRIILDLIIANKKIQTHPTEQSDVTQPPKHATKLLEYLLPKKEQPSIIGDLQEEFDERYAQFGYRKAAWWYRWQVLKTLWFFLWRIGRNAIQRIK